MKARWLLTAALGAAAVATRQTFGRWHRRWGATDDEVGAVLPSDSLIAAPAHQCTRAITIAAPPDAVWPWLVQIGADRGGFYSYDWLENLFGLGIHSADVIVPAWQQRAVGDLVFANAAGTGGWRVMEVRRDEALVLQVADVAERRPLRRDEAFRWEFLWTFVLRPGPDGTTRLLVRERSGFGSPVTRVLLAPVGLVSFVMTRRMMRGIKARAERTGGATTS